MSLSCIPVIVSGLVSLNVSYKQTMISHQPAEEAVDLYNKLIALSFSNQAEIGAIEWQLRKLHRAMPMQARVSVALLQAFLMSGKAVNALNLADQIFGQKQWFDTDPTLTFMQQLLSLGKFEQCLEFINENMILDKRKSNEAIARFNCALGIGDLKLAQDSLNYGNAEKEFVSLLEAFSSSLAELDIDTHFSAHQNIVRDVIREKQTDCSLRLTSGEEGTELTVFIFVSAERKERDLIEQSIDDALAEYYREEGFDPYVFVPLINTLVVNISSHWPPQIN